MNKEYWRKTHVQYYRTSSVDCWLAIDANHILLSFGRPWSRVWFFTFTRCRKIIYLSQHTSFCFLSYWRPNSFKRACWHISGARGHNFGMSHHLHPYLVYASSEGSGYSAHVRRIAWDPLPDNVISTKALICFNNIVDVFNFTAVCLSPISMSWTKNTFFFFKLWHENTNSLFCTTLNSRIIRIA